MNLGMIFGGMTFLTSCKIKNQSPHHNLGYKLIEGHKFCQALRVIFIIKTA